MDENSVNCPKPDNDVIPFIHSMDLAFFQCEPSDAGKITFINRTGASILGYDTIEEALEAPLRDHFLDHNDFEIWLKSHEKNAKQKDFETICKKKNSKMHTIGITSSLVTDAGGRKVRIDGFINDIHLTKKEELEKDVIANINKILVSNINMKEVDHLICDQLYKIIEWDRVSIVLMENKGDVVVDFVIIKDKKHKSGLSKAMPERSHYPLIGSILEKVSQSGKPYIIPDTSLSKTDTDKVMAKEGIRSRLAYPLKYKEELIGSINFGYSEVNYYNEEHCKLLDKIGPFLAFGIENSKLYQRATKAEKEYKDLSQTFDSPWG